MIMNALENRPLPVYGDGMNVREWIYTDEHSRAVLTALEKGKPGEVYNVAANEEHENVELVRLLIHQLGVDESLIRHVEDRAGHDRRYSLDATKVQSLGWEPRREWESSIRATIDWYRDNRDWWEPIKRSGGFREYYDKQYAARLG